MLFSTKPFTPAIAILLATTTLLADESDWQNPDGTPHPIVWMNVASACDPGNPHMIPRVIVHAHTTLEPHRGKVDCADTVLTDEVKIWQHRTGAASAGAAQWYLIYGNGSGLIPNGGFGTICIDLRGFGNGGAQYHRPNPNRESPVLFHHPLDSYVGDDPALKGFWDSSQFPPYEGDCGVHQHAESVPWFRHAIELDSARIWAESFGDGISLINVDSDGDGIGDKHPDGSPTPQLTCPTPLRH